jgi:prepilin-type N-terminal cleavage/methylation domain-containing protein
VIAIKNNNHGFTLIELMITISIIAVIAALVGVSANSIMGANLRSTSSGLAGSIRYTYDLAARKSNVFRIVFSLDEQAYWVETSSEKFLLNREKTEVDQGAVVEEDDEDRFERSRRFVDRTAIDSGEMWQPKKKATFSSFAGRNTPKVNLPDGITFQDVWISHQTDKVTTGLAYLYAFPTGQMENAVIHIGDEDDTYTLEVEALTGRVMVTPYYVEGPEE